MHETSPSVVSQTSSQVLYVVVVRALQRPAGAGVHHPVVGLVALVAVSSARSAADVTTPFTTPFFHMPRLAFIASACAASTFGSSFVPSTA